MCLQWVLLCLLTAAVSAPSHAPASLASRCSGRSLQPRLLPPPVYFRHASSHPHGGKGEGWRGARGWRMGLGVGVMVLFALEYRHLRKRLETEEETAKDWEITCYRLVPLRALSRAWGWAMEKELPTWARPHLIAWYAAAFSCNLGEAQQPDLAAYASLGEFFGRSLKDGVRPIDQNDPLVSPADGKVLQVGPVLGSRVQQVKGVTYSLDAFLGDPSWITEAQWGRGPNLSKRLLHHESGTRLYQCVIYLAPGDYHRFHSPADWRVHFRRHFQGELLSVNPMMARLIPDLFSLNERAVYVGEWQHGFFSLTAVGATNVGSIHVYCDEQLRTNQRRWQHHQRHKDEYLGPMQEGVAMSKGEPFGEFKLGSTVVLLFEAPEDFQMNIDPTQKVLYGQPLSQHNRSDTHK